MDKWYESPKADNSPIISSRIRLARNFKQYPFPLMLAENDALKIMDETVKSLINEENQYEDTTKGLKFVRLDNKSLFEKRILLEKHIISPAFIQKNKNIGLITQENEAINIMLNEEDHIRIQSIQPGDEIDKAFEQANYIDDLIERNIEYAFDKNFGYLTACPSNTGTGLRASFMVHLPMLEKSQQLKNIILTLGKFGMTVRGIYGEGTESFGSIYQISNQLTLGKSEEEILDSLKNVTAQIIGNEKWLLEQSISKDKYEMMDAVYRSYGVLTNCRKITSKVAMGLLSKVRLGYITGLLDVPRPTINIYNIMMNIQPSNLQKYVQKDLDENERDIFRAEYIRNVFNNK